MKKIILILFVFTSVFCNGAKLIIDLGQSNRYGNANNSSLDAAYKQAFSNIQTWTGATFAALDYSVPNNQYPTPTTRGGSEFARCVALQSYFNDVIYRVEYAVGGTKLATDASQSDWNTANKGELYDLAKTEVNKAIAYMWNTLGIRKIDFYIFWDQGEADCKIPANASAYQTNLSDFITGFNNSLGGTAFSSSKKIWVISKTNLNVQSSGDDATVTNATNANPIVITTLAAHTLTTGMVVTISGVTGNTAANGTFTITYVNATSYSLNSSTGDGVYSAGGEVNAYTQTSTVNTGQNNLANGTTIFVLATEGFETTDFVHRSNLGYKDQGLAEADVIINNGL